MKSYRKYCLAAIIMALPFTGLSQPKFSLQAASNHLPRLYGKKENARYLCVTAGDRLYSIGDQAGNFPSVGFHVPGEMGGVWQHPVKLLDGFRLTITDSKTGVVEQAGTCDRFVTYSFTTQYVYNFPQERLSVTRTQFVPDGLPVLILEYAFTNNDHVDKDLTVQLATDVNLRPVWLGERSGMIDSTDALLSYDSETKTVFFKDNNNPWYAGISADGLRVDFSGTQPSPYPGKGITGNLCALIHVAKGATALLRFYISGSIKNTAEIQLAIGRAKKMLPQLFLEKEQRYHQLEKNARIDMPDTALMEAYQWGKYTSDWLVRDVPGMGRAMSAGLPDYPWFFSNDQAATFPALTGTIQPDIFFSSWKMLKQLSYKANGNNGSIIHEASTNGVVYATGRMEESQLHIITAWDIFKWTGDTGFLTINYIQGKKLWKWLQQHDANHNGYIEGYGGVEIKGLNAEMLDVQVATQRFLEVMGNMAHSLNDIKAADNYHQKAEQLRININRDWWVPEEKRYADFISTREKAVDIIDSALAHRVHPERNSWALQKLTGLKASILNHTYTNKGYVVYYNSSGISLLEEGIADTAKALEALQRIGFFTNKYGMYISGIERPDDIHADEGSFKHDSEFNYNRAVMPAAIANLAIAACRYGSPDTALQYIHTMLNSFGFATPGTMYEVSPDYGMFVQAWNIRGVNIPLIQYFFGIDPLAYKKEISLHPAFPSAWEHASIKNVIIGDNLLSISYSKLPTAQEYIITNTAPHWTLKFYVGRYRTVLLNGKNVWPKNGYIILKENRNKVRIIP
jgi:glycogen debranching enzyme